MSPTCLPPPPISTALYPGSRSLVLSAYKTTVVGVRKTLRALRLCGEDLRCGIRTIRRYICVDSIFTRKQILPSPSCQIRFADCGYESAIHKLLCVLRVLCGSSFFMPGTLPATNPRNEIDPKFVWNEDGTWTTKTTATLRNELSPPKRRAAHSMHRVIIAQIWTNTT